MEKNRKSNREMLLEQSRFHKSFFKFHLECFSLLFSFWDKWIEASPLPGPRHTVPKPLAFLIVLKLYLAQLLDIAILVQAVHGHLILLPAGVFGGSHSTCFLGLPHF